jgi:hypothetical protein
MQKSSGQGNKTVSSSAWSGWRSSTVPITTPEFSTVGAIAVPTTNSMKIIDIELTAERQRRTQPPLLAKS